jgi:DNA-binding LytR/AlgR family response regulator
MAETEALLPSLIFMRIHSSYLVSKKHITKIEKACVWINQTELPVGTAYAA